MSTFWCGMCGAALTTETEDSHRCEVDPLATAIAERDEARSRLARVLASVEAPETAVAVAKVQWDRFEADYWDSPRDRRPFDPTLTELDADDCDRGASLVAEVAETLADLGDLLADAQATTDEAVSS